MANTPYEAEEKTIHRLQKAVEVTFGRPVRTPQDFDLLSQSIFDKLHERISSSTLKRLWGYVSSSAIPRESTLDLLSKFVGYANYEDFCQGEKIADSPSASPSAINTDSPKPLSSVDGKSVSHNRKSRFWFWLTFIIVISLLAILMLVLPNRSSSPAANNATHELNGHVYVDLGLPSGTCWATMNVGSSAPEDFGNYFSWGETKVKDSYEWDSYSWFQGDPKSLIKYNPDPYYGKPDGLLTIEAADDAANVLWGEGWRTPTDEEWTELRQNCAWQWTTLNDIAGYRVTSTKNGNSIFLPAAGYIYGIIRDDCGKGGHYWSSTLSVDNPTCVWNVCFHADTVERSDFRSFRSNGMPIRPVIQGLKK